MKTYSQLLEMINEAKYVAKFENADGASAEANALSKTAKTKKDHVAAAKAHLKAGVKLHELGTAKENVRDVTAGANEHQQATWHRLKAQEHSKNAGSLSHLIYKD